MKKVLVVALLILALPIVGFGQRFNFADSIGTWNVASTYPAPTSSNTGFCATTTLTYGFKGDTLISSILWRKMFYTSDTNISSSTNLKKIGYLRTINNLVLFIDTAAHLDTLYNFNLHVGDSVFYNICSQGPYVYVSNIDSIIVNGKYHKRFFFTEPVLCPNSFTYMKEVWLEGIGSLHGPLNSWHPHLTSTEYPDTANLTCYKHSDTIIWFNPNYHDCIANIVLSIADIVTPDSRVSIYPNPASTSINLSISKFDNSKTNNVEIYNTIGECVHRKIATSTNCQIDVSDLAEGVYQFTIHNSQFIITKRLVIVR